MITFFGWLWWWVIPIRKRLAVENYLRAFPERDATELRRCVGEMVWGYLELAMGRRAQVHGAELVEAGGICLAGHGGAWDLALISAGADLRATIFVRTPSNPLIAWWIMRQRRRSGLDLLPPSGSALSAYRALRSGRLVVFVQDQRHNQGVAVPFFGRPALTSRGFGVLAARTGAPLFCAWQWRDEQGEHHIQIERLDVDVPVDPDAAVMALTEASQRFYEDKIRQRPYSWLWLHDRWRPLEH
jgi:Kdo2-lipid IVA lauroyltransferase/acyltransferase